MRQAAPPCPSNSDRVGVGGGFSAWGTQGGEPLGPEGRHWVRVCGERKVLVEHSGGEAQQRCKLTIFLGGSRSSDKDHGLLTWLGWELLPEFQIPSHLFSCHFRIILWDTQQFAFPASKPDCLPTPNPLLFLIHKAASANNSTHHQV